MKKLGLMMCIHRSWVVSLVGMIDILEPNAVPVRKSFEVENAF